MKNSVRWIVGSVLAGLATAPTAQAAPFCERLDRAMAATAEDDPRAEFLNSLLSGFGPSKAACSFSLDLSGSRSANCDWAFRYRSDEARNGFLDMLAQLTACAVPASVMEADQPVNHPDFYDLRLMQVSGGDVGLSLKDKAANQQTHVFLRLTPDQPD